VNIPITEKELKVLLDILKNKEEYKELYSKLWRINSELHRRN
jgi:hypothetical protein